MEIIAAGDAEEDPGGFSGKYDRGGDFPGLDLGDGIRLAQVDFDDRNGQQPEHIARRDLRAGARIGKIHLLPVKVLKRFDSRTCHNVHLFLKHSGDIGQPLIQSCAKFARGGEIAQHVRRRDSCIHALKVQHIANVLCAAHSDDGQHAQTIVVENHSEVVGNVQVGFARASGDDRNRIRVELSLPLCLGARRLGQRNSAAQKQARQRKDDRNRPNPR